MRLHLSHSNAVFSPCHESITYLVPLRRFALFRRSLASAAPLRLRPATAEHDASAALPDDQRRPDCFLLFGRTLHRPEGRRSGPPPDERPGLHLLPHFSPDGKQLAFTSQYDGNTEVYVMPGDGGEPKRLTTTATLSRDDVSDRMGPNNIVMGWENTQPLVVFRSRRTSFNSFIGDLETVGLNAELPKQLPVPRGGFVSFAPDDSKMAFNRVFREFRTWKHYRGGMADDVWIFDFKTHDRKSDERSWRRTFARCGDRITTFIFSPIAMGE